MEVVEDDREDDESSSEITGSSVSATGLLR